jgi:hypothetical protein
LWLHIMHKFYPEAGYYLYERRGAWPLNVYEPISITGPYWTNDPIVHGVRISQGMGRNAFTIYGKFHRIAPEGALVPKKPWSNNYGDFDDFEEE